MTATVSPTEPGPPVPQAVRRSRGEQTALAALLLATAALLLWNLGAVGNANRYYTVAVQAMTRNWTAFFFGSLDAGNLITVDKPPAALWVMALSARVFGFSSWSMLVPQALMGVAAVALLYATVRRVAGPTAGLLAGTALALTRVVVEMFRFNNPDALLVLLLVGAAYATVRAIETAGTRWLLFAGTLVGLAFLTKMAQAFVVLPALALAYLVAAPTGLGRRVGQLFAAGGATVVAGGWWVAIVELWPAGSRPYIGGSNTNSVLELALGYNGLGRIFGQRGGAGAPGGSDSTSGSGAPGGTSPELVMVGPTASDPGLGRMFGMEVGEQVSWLLPAALVLLTAVLWWTRRAPRTDRLRASVILWGAWTVITAGLFSFAEGIFHGYYTVALAPGIAALAGIGGHVLWAQRRSWSARLVLAAVVAVTAAWAWVLLGRTPDFLPWLRGTVAAAGAVTAAAVLVVPRAERGHRAIGDGALDPRPLANRRAAVALALAMALTGLAAPAAYALREVVDPGARSMSGGPRVMGPAPGPGNPGQPDGPETIGVPPGPGRPGVVGGPPPEQVHPELAAMLRAAGTAWSAATIGAQGGGADLALSSNTSVMYVGGFAGSDPAPTLEQFQEYVAAGEVRYFVSNPIWTNVPAGAGQAPRPPADEQSARIAAWVEENFSGTTVGNHTVYDLTREWLRVLEHS